MGLVFNFNRYWIDDARRSLFFLYRITEKKKCKLNFDEGINGLTFTSSSGKIKNLMKDFRKYKEENRT
jgi:hypothetical protein